MLSKLAVSGGVEWEEKIFGCWEINAAVRVHKQVQRSRAKRARKVEGKKVCHTYTGWQFRAVMTVVDAWSLNHVPGISKIGDKEHRPDEAHQT